MAAFTVTENEAAVAWLDAGMGAVSDAVITLDANRRITALNPVAQRLTGWSSHEAVGRLAGDVLKLLPDTEFSDDVGAADASSPLIDTLILSLLADDGAVPLAPGLKLMPRSGRARLLSGSGTAVRDESNEVLGLMFVLQDATRDRRMLQNLRRTENLRVIGQLAAGIAHDFNNILGVVGGSADTIMADSASKLSEGSQRLLQRVVDAVDRAGELTTRLLAFGADSPRTHVRVSLHELIHDAWHMVEPSLPPGVTLSLALNAGRDQIVGDRLQIENALLNLILNAGHAIAQCGRGGQVTVGTSEQTYTRKVEGDASFTQGPGPFLLVEVADNGAGMSPETRQKIFTPFYTTRLGQGGTGLGLSAVRGAVRDHHGFIEVEAEEGVGSRFRIGFPVAD